MFFFIYAGSSDTPMKVIDFAEVKRWL